MVQKKKGKKKNINVFFNKPSQCKHINPRALLSMPCPTNKKDLVQHIIAEIARLRAIGKQNRKKNLLLRWNTHNCQIQEPRQVCPHPPGAPHRWQNDRMNHLNAQKEVGWL